MAMASAVGQAVRAGQRVFAKDNCPLLNVWLFLAG